MDGGSHEVEKVRPTTGELIGVLVRGTFGMVPGGALLAEAAGLAWITHDRLMRASETATAMAEPGADLDGLLEAVHADERLQVLALQAIEVGAVTALRRKRLLLGRVVRRAVADRARIDESQLIADTLRSLDAPHISALVRMRAAEAVHLSPEEVPPPDAPSDSDLASRQERGRAAVLAAAQDFPDPVINPLVFYGCMRQAALWDTVGTFLPGATTAFGRQLLRDLEKCQ